MGQKESAAAFLTAVEQSFLREEEKEALRQDAGMGVTQELWSRFNDQLIAAIVRSQADQQRFVSGLDEEINRYTIEYEKEKTVLDRQFRDELRRAGEGQVQQQLWSAYKRKIGALQTRLLKEVKQTSTSVLHDVVLATVPVRDQE
jgi:hypothetical protein